MENKMNYEFQKGLKKKRIISFTQGTMLVKKELNTAKDDLHRKRGID